MIFDGFERSDATYDGVTRTVFRGGSGPCLVVSSTAPFSAVAAVRAAGGSCSRQSSSWFRWSRCLPISRVGVEHMPTLPETAYFTIAPNWVCEVLSKSTEVADRTKKLPIYAAHGVGHVWLIDPIAKTLEVHTLDDSQRWRDVRVYEGDVRVRAEPFTAIDLDLAGLWATPKAP